MEAIKIERKAMSAIGGGGQAIKNSCQKIGCRVLNLKLRRFRTHHSWFVCLQLSVVLALGGCSDGRLEQNVISFSDAAFQPYKSRFDRPKPIVAVVGENSFTELTDYVIPYGVLTESGVAEVFSLGSQEGAIQMFPALRIKPQATVTEFDSHYPNGADYVFVPAVHNSSDPILINWIIEQSDKGATIIGVCDGVRVVANAGLLSNKKAVGHWYSLVDLSEEFTETKWFRNTRYIADGNVVTTTGVTASIPVSIALVDSIAGREKAELVAKKLGVEDWGAEHTSDDFRLTLMQVSTAALNWLSFFSKEEIAIPIVSGVDEIALALTADAYSRTYKSKAFSVSNLGEEIISKRGLKIIPDSTINQNQPSGYDRVLAIDKDLPSALALDLALSGIAELYGERTTDWVALQLEYPKNN